jgi:hypothetical protein
MRSSRPSSPTTRRPGWPSWNKRRYLRCHANLVGALRSCPGALSICTRPPDGAGMSDADAVGRGIGKDILGDYFDYLGSPSLSVAPEFFPSVGAVCMLPQFSGDELEEPQGTCSRRASRLPPRSRTSSSIRRPLRQDPHQRPSTGRVTTRRGRSAHRERAVVCDNGHICLMGIMSC